MLIKYTGKYVKIYFIIKITFLSFCILPIVNGFPAPVQSYLLLRF